MKKICFFYPKRLFDIFSSLIGFIILFPFLIIISIIQIISLRSFNIIFIDKRVGLNGKEIPVLKFRTMHIDAESNIEKYLNEEQLMQWKTNRKIDNDPRVTKFGKFLRATSLDELLQFLNIFIGDMSVVGPRPITFDELNNNFNEEQKKLLLSVRPGLIGVWGVNGRNNVSFENGKRQELELSYFEKLSLVKDISIIFKAIPAVISKKGAK